MDLESGVWCTSIGHNHLSVKQALIDQMERIGHVGYHYSCDVVERAASEVITLLGLENGKCVFLSSGSEAVEFATQAGGRISGDEKPYILYLKNHFLSSYGQSSSRLPDRWIPIDVSTGDEQQWKQALDRLPFDKIGAFVFEPGNASGLVRLPPKERIAQIAEQVTVHGGLIVVDEVTTGFGRTGAWFGFEHYDISPDIVACGKGMGNGYPVSCIAMRGKLAEQLLDMGFLYAQSHQNDPLGCAVVCSVISEIRDRGLIAQAADVGRYFKDKLIFLAEKCERISAVRGIGLMLAVALSPDAPIEQIHSELFEAGFIVGINVPNRVLRIYPPLILDRQMVDAFITCFESILC